MRGNVPVRFGGGRLETCLTIGNAPTAYPIEEVTGSSPVAPIKELARETLPGVPSQRVAKRSTVKRVT